MKVLILNGSPRNGGNTAIGLKEVADTLNKEGIETITINGVMVKGTISSVEF